MKNQFPKRVGDEQLYNGITRPRPTHTIQPGNHGTLEDFYKKPRADVPEGDNKR